MLALVATPAALLAQSSTTSALTGLVRDAKGKPLPGATVRISSSAMIGGEKVMRTAENGTYRFPMLPPRALPHCRGDPWPDLPLRFGAPGTGPHLDGELGSSPPAASAVVEVVESAANMDATPVGVTANYNTTELATLPTERTLSGIMNLTPGVNSTRAWGGDSRDNAYMMDGINISDPQSNSRWIEPNPDWFSEIQVGGIGAPRGIRQLQWRLRQRHPQAGWQRDHGQLQRLLRGQQVGGPLLEQGFQVHLGGSAAGPRQELGHGPEHRRSHPQGQALVLRLRGAQGKRGNAHRCGHLLPSE